MRPAFLRRLRVMASMLTEITRIRPMTTYVDPDDTDSRSMPLRVVAMTRAPRGCQPDAPHPAEQADAADHRSSNGLESQVATPDAMVTEAPREARMIPPAAARVEARAKPTSLMPPSRPSVHRVLTHRGAPQPENPTMAQAHPLAKPGTKCASTALPSSLRGGRYTS